MRWAAGCAPGSIRRKACKRFCPANGIGFSKPAKHVRRVNLATPWSRATDRMLARILRQPTGGQIWTVALITVLVLLIGVADYLTDPRVSLVIFYLVPVTLAVVWLGWLDGIATAIASVVVRQGGDYIASGYRIPHPVTWWNFGAAFCVFLVVIWILHALITLHRQLEQRIVERTQALEEAARNRQLLEQELLEVGSRERNAFGRELHDDLCQHLVGTALAAKVLAQHLTTSGDATAARDAQNIVSFLENGVAKTRSLARGLMLSAIEPADFPRELTELAEGASASGVTCRFHQEGHPEIPNAGTAAQLFRIAQEALRNAVRHARPRQIDIVLSGDNQSTCLTITDDGAGLPPAETRARGMGLRIMEHRAAFVGARLTIVSAPGMGTQILCHLPRSLLSTAA